MTQQQDRIASLRAAFLPHLLKKAERSVNPDPIVWFGRVLLSVLYLFLIVMSYNVLGIGGPVFISGLFLVAFFIPNIYKIAGDWRRNHRQ